MLLRGTNEQASSNVSSFGPTVQRNGVLHDILHFRSYCAGLTRAKTSGLRRLSGLTQLCGATDSLALSRLRSRGGRSPALAYGTSFVVVCTRWQISCYQAQSHEESEKRNVFICLCVTRVKQVLCYITDSSHSRNTPTRFLRAGTVVGALEKLDPLGSECRTTACSNSRLVSALAD